MMVFHHLGGTLAAQHVLGQQGGQILVNLIDIGHTAAKDYHVRVEQIDNVRQRSGQTVDKAAKGGFSQGFALAHQRHNFNTACRLATMGTKVPHKACARNKGFDAIGVAAEAAGGVKLICRHPRQRVMAPFTANAVTTAMYLVVNRNTCAAAGAQNGTKYQGLDRKSVV